jgi:hypothetical protein
MDKRVVELKIPSILIARRDSSVGTANRYGQDGRGVRFPKGVRVFPLLHSVRTDSGAHPASYPMGTGGSFPGDKPTGPTVADLPNGLVSFTPPREGRKKSQLLQIEGVAWSAQRIPTVVNLGFLDRRRYFFLQVAHQLSSRG